VSATLDEMLNQSLRFEYQSGGQAKLKRSHSTGWRTVPGLMISQAHCGGEAISLRDGTSVEARDGDLFVLPSGVWHEVRVITPRESRRWVHVNYFVLGHLDLCSLLQMPLHAGRALGRRIGDLIGQWLRDSAKIAPDRTLRLNARRNEFGFRLLALLSEVMQWRLGAQARVARTQRLAPVLERMNRDFQQPIRRDELAQLACLSPAQFHAVFRETIGTTPAQCLREIRIRNAQRLLLQTEAPIKAIAEQCGLGDPFAFSRCFRRICGISPSDYRARSVG
jgi:AraC-like DNA-binding protein